MRTWKFGAPSIALFVGLFSASTFAIIPDSGWYSNTAESGRGFNIEIQNNVLFMAGFMYDAGGRQLWVVTGGPMSTDHTYSGAANATANGQPLGGRYNAPAVMPFGTASITFTTATTANITVNGYSFPVTRQLFGFDFTSAAQPLLGELSMVEGTFGMYFGDRIVFTRTMVSSDGTLFAAGNKTGDTTRIAVGSYVPGLQKWTVLLDTSTSYYDYYTFVFDGLNLIEGDDYTYLKTSMPSGSLPMVGFRTKSAQAAAGSNAPGTIRAQMAESNANVSNDYSVAKTTIQAAKVLEPSEFETLRVLEMMLESIRQQR